MTPINSGTMEVDSGCPSVPDASLSCRTFTIPTNVVRDGYLVDYPLLTY